MSSETSRLLVDAQAPARELTPAQRPRWRWGVYVLVDRQGQIRHYYNSTDQDALRRVPRDVRRLLQGH